MTKVFVYGTLKRDGSNHSFLATQQFLGDARTEPGYTLFSLGDFPGMVRATNSSGVTGELWEVSDSCLAKLDELEGVAVGFYARVALTLAPPLEGLSVETYLYSGSIAGRTPLDSVWRE